jgi:hypothetical protein
VGSIIPAAWSFMLAARARGLGSVWTTLHLRHERQAAELLGIPFEAVMQVALIPVAYTVGTDFRPAAPIPWTRWSTGGSGRPAGSRPARPIWALPTAMWQGICDLATEPSRRAPRSRPWGPR